MVAGNKEQGSRIDHGEWILHEGEEPAGRGVSHAEQAAVSRRSGPGFLTFMVIILVLGVIALGSLMAPILAQRPWVGPLNGQEEVMQGLMAGRAMKVRVTLKNSGRTPAANLRVAIRLLIGKPPPAPSPVLGECGQSAVAMPQSVLFPDANYAKTVAVEQSIDDGMVAAVLRNDQTVYLTGCIQYEDSVMQWLHRSAHQTHFCRIFVPASAGNYGILGGFEDCPAGNTAD